MKCSIALEFVRKQLMLSIAQIQEECEENFTQERFDLLRDLHRHLFNLQNIKDDVLWLENEDYLKGEI